MFNSFYDGVSIIYANYPSMFNSFYGGVSIIYANYPSMFDSFYDGVSIIYRSRNSRPAPAKTDSNHHLAGSIAIIALQKSRFEITLSMKYFFM